MQEAAAMFTTYLLVPTIVFFVRKKYTLRRMWMWIIPIAWCALVFFQGSELNVEVGKAAFTPLPALIWCAVGIMILSRVPAPAGAQWVIPFIKKRG